MSHIENADEYIITDMTGQTSDERKVIIFSIEKNIFYSGLILGIWYYIANEISNRTYQASLEGYYIKSHDIVPYNNASGETKKVVISMIFEK